MNLHANLIPWTIPGYADELALATGDGRLWVAASTATLATEEVWFGEVTAAGVAGSAQVADETCCRPAITAVGGGGVLAIACSPAGRILGAYQDPRGAVHRWRVATDGVPVHVSTATADGVTWVAIELARGGGRRLLVAAIDPATGVIREGFELGDALIWCRWPVLIGDARGPILAWCEGPPRAPGAVKYARWTGGLVRHEVSHGAGEAPAIAVMPGDRIAIAWHRGGPSTSSDDRDASVVRSIDVAIVDLARAGEPISASPPAGAGGADPRGEDQGWELPAITHDAAGAIWLVGRSTHGHHVARRAADGTWSMPASLCTGDWGGRGRRHALAVHAGEVWLARRAPSGIAIGPCPAPPATVARPAARISHPVRDVAPVPGMLFGDLHQHTAHSDGCGGFEDLWIAARDRRGLDFAAITDHDQFCRRALGPATWQLASQIAGEFDDSGRFVALAAYEFTGPRYPGPGHKCVYFGNRVPDRVPDRDVDILFALLRELGGIAVPHHVGWTGGDFSHHDPVVQPVWELCSVHGCYEAEGGCAAHPPRADHIIPGQFVRDALDAGLRFGFIGSTDSHGLDWHHGIARWRNPFRAGLAGIIGAERTRDGIIAAMRARRSFATTGARIGLRVELDGAVMGSELPAGSGGELVVEVTPTAPVTRIALVHSGGEQDLEIATIGAHARARTRVAALDDPSYLYVRIEQADGEAAWASPFWLTTARAA